jgi:RNA polymerase sigma factor (sigma-70 family)
LAIEEALKQLSELDPRKSRIVELRYFGGLSIEETAKVIGASTSTVKREWDKARAWLRQELRRGHAE